MIMALRVLLLLVLSALFSPFALGDGVPHQREIGRAGEKARFLVIKAQGKWGLAVIDAGMASVLQPEPIAFEFYKAPDTISHLSSGYDRLETSSGRALGIAHVAGPDGTSFTVEDRWSISGIDIQLARKVTVAGTANFGFLTSITFSHPEAHPRSEVDYFAPGMITEVRGICRQRQLAAARPMAQKATVNFKYGKTGCLLPCLGFISPMALRSPC
jgi:hypothetical protein